MEEGVFVGLDGGARRDEGVSTPHGGRYWRHFSELTSVTLGDANVVSVDRRRPRRAGGVVYAKMALAQLEAEPTFAVGDAVACRVGRGMRRLRRRDGAD